MEINLSLRAESWDTLKVELYDFDKSVNVEMNFEAKILIHFNHRNDLRCPGTDRA